MDKGPRDGWMAEEENEVKKLSLAEWEAKYIVEKLEQFDQKHTMFERPGWDPDIHGAVESWAIRGTVSRKPGYRLEEWALHWASRRGTLMNFFNTSKPASGKEAKLLAKGLAGLETTLLATASQGPPPGAELTSQDPEELSRTIKKAALWFGADMVGICRLDRRFLYSHVYDAMPYMGKGSDELVRGDSVPQEIPESYQWAVVMGFEQDYDLISRYPTFWSNAASSMGYSRLTITNHYLSTFIRNLGFQAIDCAINDVALSIPLAMLAGLGDLGRNGLLITPAYGPRVRISQVLTDMPLVADQPIDFGVTEFCEACEICAEKCPSQSILYGDRTAEPNNISNAAGALKWPINAETCRMYWGKINQGCTTCMAACPFNKLDTPFHRMVRWFVDHARWGDRFYVWMDKIMGYGRPRPVDHFWDEWKPGRRKGLFR
ncbi:MAG: reductive dehalogenase [Deltaproteobacteria bacterium]|nr:reductive dehalogenase [Deltaproteobacteria bacterium]